jgi:hypothetical protein
MATSKRARIITQGGTTAGLKVLDANGDPIKWGLTGLVRIDIEPLVVDGMVTATLTVRGIDLDLDAAVV